MSVSLDTRAIRQWRSVSTLVAFIFANLSVLWPFYAPIYVPRVVYNAVLKATHTLRISSSNTQPLHKDSEIKPSRLLKYFVCFHFPVNLITGPLIANVFLLTISAIGREEIRSGIVGSADIGICPYDIVLVFLCLGYLANSIQASGLVRYLVFRLVNWTGQFGLRLFLCLYVCFFVLGIFIGNDPIMLMFLFHMTRMSNDIRDPQAWIFTQFAIANIATGLLVSSNPTNLVLAGAFDIKFVNYTANMVVPILVTAVVLFPVLIFAIFRGNTHIPSAIKLEPRTERDEAPDRNSKYGGASLEDVLKPCLDKRSALAATAIMATTVILLLALNAVYLQRGGNTDYWVTLPAACIMFAWDLILGWLDGRRTHYAAQGQAPSQQDSRSESSPAKADLQKIGQQKETPRLQSLPLNLAADVAAPLKTTPAIGIRRARALTNRGLSDRPFTKPLSNERTTLQTLLQDLCIQCQNNFPVATTVLKQMPFPLIPFAFSMFVLVESLQGKGWIPVFAFGWDHWTKKTGVVGAIAGIAFLSAVMSNCCGTNIGTCILWTRVIKAWQEIHRQTAEPISDRLFWGTIYSLSLGVNLGAFSLSFSASMAGIMWRSVLEGQQLHKVGWAEFARVNLPIIITTMTTACTVLVAQVYVTRDGNPHYE
ncbi:hypothetical protein OPT61_g10291 [Boeremia exigua]|uniref:Uncharacterized protein n=1 Tax=Boeremia exigua TaxID=749465 RepID=A0ACC2HRT5_9PLEO|nr:hypothetical protein OPT61_g10291 [Boeremia exigua]